MGMLFCNANRATATKKHPNLKMTELSTVLSKMWKEATAAQKKPKQQKIRKYIKKNWQNIKNHLSMQISKPPMILHPWFEKYAKNLELQQKERKENSQMIQKHQNVLHLDFSYSVQIIDQEYKKNAVIALLQLENSLDKNGKA